MPLGTPPYLYLRFLGFFRYVMYRAHRNGGPIEPPFRTGADTYVLGYMALPGFSLCLLVLSSLPTVRTARVSTLYSPFQGTGVPIAPSCLCTVQVLAHYKGP